MAQASSGPRAFDYPRRLAEAVEKREIGMLLELFDTPDDRNQTTKRVLHREVGLKTLGLKAAQRREAIFLFCGYDKESRAAYETQRKAVAEDNRAKREAEEIVKHVESIECRRGTRGEIVTVRKYIDDLIAEGYTQIVERKQGNAVKYWLRNPTTDFGYPLRVKHGALAYARLAIAQLGNQQNVA
jgi:hypothetical protein